MVIFAGPASLRTPESAREPVAPAGRLTPDLAEPGDAATAAVRRPVAGPVHARRRGRPAAPPAGAWA